MPELLTAAMAWLMTMHGRTAKLPEPKRHRVRKPGSMASRAAVSRLRQVNQDVGDAVSAAPGQVGP